jgi:hypothetical protein
MSRAGVTDADHEAGIVAHTSGTIGGRAAVVSARADFAAASLALPAFLQAKSAEIPIVAAITASLFVAFIPDSSGGRAAGPSGVRMRVGTI